MRVKTFLDDNIFYDEEFGDIYNDMDIARLGIFSGYLKSIPKDYDDFLVKSLVTATKMRTNTPEEDIHIRDLIPHYDLFDGGGKSINEKTWIQVYPKNIKELADKRSGRYSIYTTDDRLYNPMILYGIQYSLERETYARELQIWRKNVKISDVFLLDQYPTKGQIDLFRTPILIKCYKEKIQFGENLDVVIKFDNDIGGYYDTIKILGYVAERIPRNTM